MNQSLSLLSCFCADAYFEPLIFVHNSSQIWGDTGGTLNAGTVWMRSVHSEHSHIPRCNRGCALLQPHSDCLFLLPLVERFFFESNHFNLGLRGWFRPQKPAIERGVCRLFLFFFNLHCSLDNQFLACCPEVLRPFADWWDCRDGRTGACCSLLLLFVALQWRTCLMASASRIFHFRSLLKDAWQITLADRRLPASRRPKNQLRRRAQGAGS